MVFNFVADENLVASAAMRQWIRASGRACSRSLEQTVMGHAWTQAISPQAAVAELEKTQALLVRRAHAGGGAGEAKRWTRRVRERICRRRWWALF